MRNGYLIFATVSAFYFPMTALADGGGKENISPPTRNITTSEQPSQQLQQLQQQVRTSQAMIVRVPVNQQGQEQSQAAQLRLVGPGAQASDITAAWENAYDVGAVPALTDDHSFSLRRYREHGFRLGGSAPYFSLPYANYYYSSPIYYSSPVYYGVPTYSYYYYPYTYSYSTCYQPVCYY